jgi:DNA-binding winged helix-turn-helix (wHTH) protein/TolB-like protein/Tfp pilus assembly protein PilF
LVIAAPPPDGGVLTVQRPPKWACRSIRRDAPGHPTESLRFSYEGAIVFFEGGAVATGGICAMSDQTSQTRERLQIGGWSVDRSANELRRGEETSRIEPKAMDVLLALAARAGEVVSREALLETVWPGVVVGDEALTQTIIKLRKALEDPPRAPIYIETIPKRGYRLIAPVVQSEVAPLTVDVDTVAVLEPARMPSAAPPSESMSAQAGASAPASAPVQGPVPVRPSALVGRSTPALRTPAVAAVLLAVALVVGVRVAQTWPQQPPLAAVGAADAFNPAAEDNAGIVTVTVLPFVTIGGGAEQDYLAQGIGSDLTTDLSRLPGVRIIDLASHASEASLARAVRYVVSGSVQRDAAMLRINVRLADARTHEQLWSQRLERPYGDLLTIQNEISRGLVAQLPREISAAEREDLAKHYTNNPAAYDNFLRAKALFLVRRPAENEQARSYYAKAIEEDPQFARAYAGLAMTYAMDGRYRRSGDPAATLERAEGLANSALQIDPDLPEVYWALGFIHVQSRRYDQAIAALQKATQLNHSYADAYALLGGIYTYTGQAARSIPLLRTALRLNPDGGHLYFLLLGRAYLFENDLEQALINLREAAKRNPEDMEAHIYLAATLVAAGDSSAARLEADEVRSHDPGFSMAAWLEGYPLNHGPYRRRLLELTSGVLN